MGGNSFIMFVRRSADLKANQNGFYCTIDKVIVIRPKLAKATKSLYDLTRYKIK